METPRQKAQQLQLKSRAERKKQARFRFRLSRSSPIFKLFAILGPGLIAANAGNDAGGIVTYSAAGASYGYNLLWALVITTVFVAIIQEMCARMGAVPARVYRTSFVSNSAFVGQLLLCLRCLSLTPV